MWNLIRAEGRKLLTTRTPWVLAAVAVVVPVLMITVTSLAGGGTPELSTSPQAQRLLMLTAIGDASVLAMILGVLIMGGEHRHGTIVPTTLAVPRRWPVLAAKVAVAAVAGLLLTALWAGAAFGVGYAAISAQGGELLLGAEEIARTWALQGLLVAALAAVALGVAAAVRNQTVALVAVLIVAVAVVPIIAQVAPDVSWYLIPTNLGPALVEAPVEAPFGRWAATGILGGYVAAALAAGTALLTRRDIA